MLTTVWFLVFLTTLSNGDRVVGMRPTLSLAECQAMAATLPDNYLLSVVPGSIECIRAEVPARALFAP